jgi:hypothetical protein
MRVLSRKKLDEAMINRSRAAKQIEDENSESKIDEEAADQE